VICPRFVCRFSPMMALRSNACVLLTRKRSNVAGSDAVKPQWISVISPEVGFEGAASVNAEARGAARARMLVWSYDSLERRAEERDVGRTNTEREIERMLEWDVGCR
jgi:hypothetical protein